MITASVAAMESDWLLQFTLEPAMPAVTIVTARDDFVEQMVPVRVRVPVEETNTNGDKVDDDPCEVGLEPVLLIVPLIVWVPELESKNTPGDWVELTFKSPLQLKFAVPVAETMFTPEAPDHVNDPV